MFREGLRKKERERNIGVWENPPVASLTPPAGDLGRNPGICSDWELNYPPLGQPAHTQSTELHQLGLNSKTFTRT